MCEDGGTQIRMYLDFNYVHVHSQFSLLLSLSLSETIMDVWTVKMFSVVMFLHKIT